MRSCRESAMQFRVVTLNLEQDHKRWSDRHPLIGAEIAGLRPDVIAFNEVSVPLQTAKLLCNGAIAATGIPYKLVQQTRVNGLSKVEGEALLTRFAIIETGNLDYQARDIVALVARVVIEERPVDFYVSHLYMSRGDDSLRLFQVQQLLAWIDSRADGTPSIVCGDFQRHPRCQFGRLDGGPISPDPDRAYCLHSARRPGWRGLPSLLAADGPLYRLHLDFRRHRDSRKARSVSTGRARRIHRCGPPTMPVFGPICGYESGFNRFAQASRSAAMTIPQAITFFSAAANFAASSDTPREFLERCLARLEAFEPGVGAFVCHDIAAARAAGLCRRSTVCRSASRTSSKPPTCRPSRDRRCLSAGAPAEMRRASRHCARPAR